MKKIIASFGIAALALLPLQKAEAGRYGGFAVGYTFRLKVTKVSSIRLQGATQTKVPIPTGIPRYTRGDSIPFEILSEGAIRVRRLSVPFTSGSETANMYTSVGGGSRNDAVTIFKTPSNKATAGSIMFARYDNTGSEQAVHIVTYTLERR